MLAATIFFYAPSLLPLTMAFQVNVMLPDKWKDIAVVNGKNSSTGMPRDMTRESADPTSKGLCPHIYFNYTESCDSLYYGVAKINFSSPTTNAQPIKVTLPDYTLQVSIK
jgi:hypothetical protein